MPQDCNTNVSSSKPFCLLSLPISLMLWSHFWNSFYKWIIFLTKCQVLKIKSKTNKLNQQKHSRLFSSLIKPSSAYQRNEVSEIWSDLLLKNHLCYEKVAHCELYTNILKNHEILKCSLDHPDY
jgi:hypothetical protein